MKKIMLSVFSLLLFANLFCQDASHQVSKDVYLQKSRHQKIAAWSLLGGGVASFIAGAAINSSQPYIGSSADNNQGIWLSYLGAASAITSVPFFLSAGKNKKKARALITSTQIKYPSRQHIYALKTEATISIKIPL